MVSYPVTTGQHARIRAAWATNKRKVGWVHAWFGFSQQVINSVGDDANTNRRQQHVLAPSLSVSVSFNMRDTLLDGKSKLERVKGNGRGCIRIPKSIEITLPGARL